MSAPADRCRSCGARIRWVRTYAGKNMPLDFDPTEDGNVRLERAGARNGLMEVRALVLGPLERELAHTEELVLYMPHHATCPDSERWKVAG